MKCYIYKIVNKITNQVYVGQTTNLQRRLENHLSALRNNNHVNPKLQSSWNKYGEENFEITSQIYDLTKEELNKKEIEEIQKENSYENGFNLTLGGDGGNTRGNLSFEDFCFIYFGIQEYEGLTNRVADYLGIDSSTVSAIKRKAAYTWYIPMAEALLDEDKIKYFELFEKELDLANNPPKIKKANMSEKDVIDFLCVVSVYGRGAEAAMTRYLDISKGLKDHIVKGEYRNYAEKFLSLTDSEVFERAVPIFEDNNLQQYCKQRIKKNNDVIRPNFSWIAH